MVAGFSGGNGDSGNPLNSGKLRPMGYTPASYCQSILHKSLCRQSFDLCGRVKNNYVSKSLSVSTLKITLIIFLSILIHLDIFLVLLLSSLTECWCTFIVIIVSIRFPLVALTFIRVLNTAHALERGGRCIARRLYSGEVGV